MSAHDTISFTPLAADLRLGDLVCAVGEHRFAAPRRVVGLRPAGTGAREVVLDGGPDGNLDRTRRLVVPTDAEVDLAPPF